MSGRNFPSEQLPARWVSCEGANPVAASPSSFVAASPTPAMEAEVNSHRTILHHPWVSDSWRARGGHTSAAVLWARASQAGVLGCRVASRDAPRPPLDPSAAHCLMSPTPSLVDVIVA
ncbi:hypothetical protein HaLaN_02039 [Haematococcus lacustris]|uniref:Uncharacterized protein n=1 Tax=Haematococcus lacustris TaxID=44745 RepID=A0A699YMG6_HAELA|nr:hypothetical protein HaLaN_02039 [Haematococcus lacustris]